MARTTTSSPEIFIGWSASSRVRLLTLDEDTKGAQGRDRDLISPGKHFIAYAVAMKHAET